MVSGRDGSGVGLGERGAERLARVYATLSMAYEAIVRVRERLPLFEQVCRVLVEQGRLRMAWVGEVDDDGWIVRVAHAGVTDGYLDDIRISVRDVAEGRGPTGTVVRERQHVFVGDIATDERMAPWRDAALARGYRSSAAFPLVVDDRCVAVLTAYASEPGFFDEQEVKLFDRMAADLSFAVEAMERDEQRQALEAELRSSEERFRLATESMLDAFTILSPVRDDDGEITDFRYRYINEAYCGLVGEDQATLEAALSSMTDAVFISDADGRFVVFNEAFTTFHRFTSREQTLTSLEDYPAVLEVFMANGEPAPVEQWAVPRALRGELGTNVEYGLRRKDTGERWVGSYSFAPIRSADGTIAGSVVTGRDITAWKNAQFELEQAQRLAGVGSWTWGPGADQVTWSAQMYELFGRAQALGPAIGDALLRYVHPEDRGRVAERFELGAESESEFELDFRIIAEQGEERVVHVVGREDPSRPGRYRGTFQDVTDQRRAEAQRSELLQAAARSEEARRLNVELEQRVAARTVELERANGELETFAYSVSHDLRAPLRAMDGFSRLLSTEYAEALDERGQHYLARVRAGAQRMGTMIDDLLQLSRVSRAELHRDRIDLSELAGQIAGELQAADPGRRVEVVISDGLTAGADRELVRIALENLLGNAWKFTSTCEHARIEFTARECGDRREFVVRDNGVGFDMQHAGQLFRPFQRLHGANEFPGTGIGLASVDRIIARHGGHVSAQGDVGRGATFAFTLEANGEAR